MDRLEDGLEVLRPLRLVVLVEHVLTLLVEDSVLLGIVLNLLLQTLDLLL